jgi:hypothetical protein
VLGVGTVAAGLEPDGVDLRHAQDLLDLILGVALGAVDGHSRLPARQTPAGRVRTDSRQAAGLDSGVPLRLQLVLGELCLEVAAAGVERLGARTGLLMDGVARLPSPC